MEISTRSFCNYRISIDKFRKTLKARASRLHFRSPKWENVLQKCQNGLTRKQLKQQWNLARFLIENNSRGFSRRSNRNESQSTRTPKNQFFILLFSILRIQIQMDITLLMIIPLYYYHLVKWRIVRVAADRPQSTHYILR